jgi:hypothetical protein
VIDSAALRALTLFEKKTWIRMGIIKCRYGKKSHVRSDDLVDQVRNEILSGPEQGGERARESVFARLDGVNDLICGGPVVLLKPSSDGLRAQRKGEYELISVI